MLAFFAKREKRHEVNCPRRKPKKSIGTASECIRMQLVTAMTGGGSVDKTALPMKNFMFGGSQKELI